MDDLRVLLTAITATPDDLIPRQQLLEDTRAAVDRLLLQQQQQKSTMTSTSTTLPRPPKPRITTTKPACGYLASPPSSRGASPEPESASSSNDEDASFQRLSTILAELQAQAEAAVAGFKEAYDDAPPLTPLPPIPSTPRMNSWVRNGELTPPPSGGCHRRVVAASRSISEEEETEKGEKDLDRLLMEFLRSNESETQVFRVVWMWMSTLGIVWLVVGWILGWGCEPCVSR